MVLKHGWFFFDFFSIILIFMISLFVAALCASSSGKDSGTTTTTTGSPSPPPSAATKGSRPMLSSATPPRRSSRHGSRSRSRQSSVSKRQQQQQAAAANQPSGLAGGDGESKNEGRQALQKSSFLYDRYGERKLRFMCHHCGTVVSKDEVQWGHIKRNRCAPWKAESLPQCVEDLHLIIERPSESKAGMSSVSVCVNCLHLPDSEFDWPGKAQFAEEKEQRLREMSNSSGDDWRGRAKKRGGGGAPADYSGLATANNGPSGSDGGRSGLSSSGRHRSRSNRRSVSAHGQHASQQQRSQQQNYCVVPPLDVPANYAVLPGTAQLGGDGTSMLPEPLLTTAAAGMDRNGNYDSPSKALAGREDAAAASASAARAPGASYGDIPPARYAALPEDAFAATTTKQNAVTNSSTPSKNAYGRIDDPMDHPSDSKIPVVADLTTANTVPGPILPEPELAVVGPLQMPSGTAPKPCPSCHGPCTAGSQVALAGSMAFHPACFRCSVCSNSFPKLQFFSTLRGPTCASCIGM